MIEIGLNKWDEIKCLEGENRIVNYATLIKRVIL